MIGETGGTHHHLGHWGNIARQAVAQTLDIFRQLGAPEKGGGEILEKGLGRGSGGVQEPHDGFWGELRGAGPLWERCVDFVQGLAVVLDAVDADIGHLP